MDLTKTYLKRIKSELQELIGVISVKEIVTNEKLTRNYEIVHQKMLKWT